VQIFSGSHFNKYVLVQFWKQPGYAFLKDRPDIENSGTRPPKTVFAIFFKLKPTYKIQKTTRVVNHLPHRQRAASRFSGLQRQTR